jgi:hypothetical protein
LTQELIDVDVEDTVQEGFEGDRPLRAHPGFDVVDARKIGIGLTNWSLRQNVVRGINDFSVVDVVSLHHFFHFLKRVRYEPLCSPEQIDLKEAIERLRVAGSGPVTYDCPLGRRIGLFLFFVPK